MSHPQALGQCRHWLKERGIVPVSYPDTAGAAALVAELNDPKIAALAPPPAAAIYGLDTLESDIADAEHNTTRFVTLARGAKPLTGDGPFMTTIIFEVKNVPAALYKAMGGFATNGVNMTKLESYQQGGSFAATDFLRRCRWQARRRQFRPGAGGIGVSFQVVTCARQLPTSTQARITLSYRRGCVA